MTVDTEYLNYPNRKHAMDHELYQWSDMFTRKPIVWPNKALVALWVMPILQWFPLNAPAKPFRAPGSLTMPYPDFRHYSCRDYGNRVGIFRLLKTLKDLNVKPTVALNAAVAKRYPSLIAELLEHDVEFVAHGLDMGHLHYSGMGSENEDKLIKQSLEILHKSTGKTIEGWLSPARSQSFDTPNLLAANSIKYCCDWGNDDLPYAMQTAAGKLYSMPLALEADDRAIHMDFFQDENAWLEQIKARFDVLYREAKEYGGRVVSLPLHAWVSGVPYRTNKVQEALSYMLEHDGVWSANSSDILKAFTAQQDS